MKAISKLSTPKIVQFIKATFAITLIACVPIVTMLSPYYFAQKNTWDILYPPIIISTLLSMIIPAPMLAFLLAKHNKPTFWRASIKWRIFATPVSIVFIFIWPMPPIPGDWGSLIFFFICLTIIPNGILLLSLSDATIERYGLFKGILALVLLFLVYIPAMNAIL
ncbi:hypothetical protein [Chromobacterium haemolyticum]|uniref:hypothetical protein n=1 Tax=Chromobacterium haemolyticum TaxID=394935 RepID=UPI0017462A4D|nr:hypothetical protein [Chromobacterium haemolyticum]QOD85031.1 hypothetical protein IEZ30_11350 [Chromobacterium haemolyticum]